MSNKKNKSSKTLTREQYADKLKKQMERYCYIPQAGEEIRQCESPYPPFWFISNKCILFSAYYNDIKIVKLNHRPTGAKNNDGERSGQDWYYEYRVKGEKNNRHVTAHKLMADHFLECEFEHDLDDLLEVHHVKKKMSFNKNDGNICNSSDNLQILPKSIHTKATAASKKSFDPDLEAKITSSDVPTFSVPLDEFLLAVVQQYIQSVSGKGNIIYVNHANAADPKDIEVTVKPLTADDIEVIE